MGLGKTKNIEMVCAKTKRPAIRVNHSMNMSEYDVLGMEGVKKHISDDGQVVSFTEFVPGPLAEAFKYGWVYIADEYDRAHPMVLSVYQAVLEGADKLIIKHASGDWRVVYRHPNFRFMATGNTNGSGDDTGLYLGTTNQDAANMERFAVTHRVTWMDQKSEIAILVQSLKLRKDDATRLVKFANKIRNLVEQGRVSLPIGSRVLSNMALIGKKKGSFIEGITLAYANRLPETERDAAIQAATQEFES
jgi:cobaltochelatase CobS